MRRLAIIHPTRNIALEFRIRSVSDVKQIRDHLILVLLRKGGQLFFDFLNAPVDQPILARRVSQASDLPRIEPLGIETCEPQYDSDPRHQLPRPSEICPEFFG